MNIEIPTSCPCCDYKLELVNDQLFCRNSGCSAKLNKKLEHFTKVLGIKGFGPKTIEKLNLADITELFYLEPSSILEALGSQKLADKLADEINRARTADLETVIASFGIPLVGETASKKLVQVVSSIDEINYEICKQAGLGEKVTANLLDWLETEFKDIREFLPFSFKSKSKSVAPSGPTVCITGKLQSFKTKAEAAEYLTAAGYTVVDSVTKTLNYLIDEGAKSSTKRQKAEQYGVTIVTNLTQFLKDKE